ncbi:Uncharacterised protein [Acinetobacter baumannii]|nr:Uncharacterised protein [Acinetobacter baumannii]
MSRLGSHVLLLNQNIRQKTKLVLAVNYLVCSVRQQRLLNMAHLCLVHLLAKSHKGRFKTKELQSNEQD